MEEHYAPGLEGIIAGETAISTVTEGLRYRGYAVEELAAESTFIEVAYLLLNGELPTQEQLADFEAVLDESSESIAEVCDLLSQLPVHTPVMDVMRTGISLTAHFDPHLEDHNPDSEMNKALHLLAIIPLMLAFWHRHTQGLTLGELDPERSYAANLLTLLTGKVPTSLEEKALDVSLILYAEHEFNASTFTARVVASTGSDLYSAIVAAVGALKGPLHGGANEQVLAVLEEVGSADKAEQWIRTALQKKRRVMGFGHRVYKTCDPRAVYLKDYCKQLAERRGNFELENMAETIEQLIWQEKKLPPNLDWPSARLYHYLGLDVSIYTPLFVVSRVVGWSAHVIEQMRQNRLIRPSSRYVGPPLRSYVPLSDRG
ncbi:MAG: citrate/2-methylcitrate synthase [Planctomycetaceae bacterium]